jgi:hypothetical protein
MRLFRYAKAIGAEAKENYTTEALRAAIETDGRPIVRALRSAGILDLASATEVRVQTQLSVSKVGQIDLVVTATSASSSVVCWIEVKVDAGEGGDQLASYERFIASLPETKRPTLVVLGPTKLREGVPWLPWQKLREAIVSSGTTSPYWLDFKMYLEEIGMADSHDEKATGAEANALQPARRLLGKAARILTPFAKKAGASWPGSAWPTSEAKIVDALASAFVRHGTLTIANATNLRANVSAGLYHEPLTEDAWVGIWIWCRPNRVQERHAILELIAKHEWDDAWHRDEGAWELFGAYRRLTDFESHAMAAEWLGARLLQLRAAGLLNLLPKLGLQDEPEA